LALGLGIVAIIDIERDPKKHGMGRAIFAVIMGLLCSVLLVITVVVYLRARPL
jgi:hypothetical protein